LFSLTNSYSQEHASGQRPPDMKVWKRGHRGSDTSNPDKLCNMVAEARLVSYLQFFIIFSLVSVLSHLQFASPCRKSIRKKWWRLQLLGVAHWPLGHLWQRRWKSTWTVRSMHCFLQLCECEIRYLLLLLIGFFWRFALFDGVLDSREAMPSRWSSSSKSSDLMPRVSQMHLNYESMQDELRETRESVNAFIAQIHAFMLVRNKNTFIAFLTFSDIYVCFILFAS
jgi:hypothetical protein